jgi:tetraacyldisaccharide 4'-kinase
MRLRGYPLSWQIVTSITVLLIPVAWLFRITVKIRRLLYTWDILTRERMPVPVIIVGNISVGGAGKTPLVLWLAGFLREAGYRPGIISRGYGSNSEHARAVPASNTSCAYEFGDEPVLLALRSNCPVWIGADRPSVARALLDRHPECNILISDDGLQHYRLARDIEIAVVEATRGLGNGFTLPAGPLREPVSRLSSVDILVYNGTPPQMLTPAVTTCQMSLEGHDFYNLREPTRWTQATHFVNYRLHAIAGIGNPELFFSTLHELGLVFTPHSFADHYAYTAGDLAFPDCDAVLMTEKDAVKCTSFAGAEHWVLRVDAKAEPALGTLVLNKLGKRS